MFFPVITVEKKDAWIEIVCGVFELMALLELDQLGLWSSSSLDQGVVHVWIVGRRACGKTWLSRRLVQSWRASRESNSNRKGTLALRYVQPHMLPEDSDVLSLPTTLHQLSSARLIAGEDESITELARAGLLAPLNSATADPDESNALMETFNPTTHDLCVVVEHVQKEKKKCVFSTGSVPNRSFHRLLENNSSNGTLPASPTSVVASIFITQHPLEVSNVCRRHFKWIFTYDLQLAWIGPHIEYQGQVRVDDRVWHLYKTTQVVAPCAITMDEADEPTPP